MVQGATAPDAAVLAAKGQVQVAKLRLQLVAKASGQASLLMCVARSHTSLGPCALVLTYIGMRRQP